MEATDGVHAGQHLGAESRVDTSGEVVREANDRPRTESHEKHFRGDGRAPKLSSQMGGWPVMRGLHFHDKSLNDQEPQECKEEPKNQSRRGKRRSV